MRKCFLFVSALFLCLSFSSIASALETLAGTITDADSGAAVYPVYVEIMDLAGVAVTGASNTPDGSYSIEVTAGTYKVHFNALDGANEYLDELYDEIPCDNGGCGMADLGDTITLATGSGTTTLDEDLTRGAFISGTITGSDTLLALENITLWLFDTQCGYIGWANTDINGEYLMRVQDAGNYYLFAIANNALNIDQQSDYINQQYPGINVFDSCYPVLNDVTLGEAISVAALEQVIDKNFVLDRGATIRGTISDVNGVLANDTAVARLYKTNGEQQVIALNKEGDLSYRIGGVLPGSYHVVLSSNNLGLIDERHDDIKCPRNSCAPAQGTVIEIVTGLENLTVIDAVLDQGAVIRGNLIDAVSGNPIVGYCLFFYTESGVYAGLGCTDENGNFESRTGFPDGNYRMSNQINAFEYQPVDGGYTPQVWTSDGAFLSCGALCDFTLGDTFTVSGTSPVENINMAMFIGGTISGTVIDSDSGNPMANVQLDAWDENQTYIISAATDANGNYTLFVGADRNYTVFMPPWGVPDTHLPEVWPGVYCHLDVCNPADAGNLVNVAGGDTSGIDFALKAGFHISGTVLDTGAPIDGVGICIHFRSDGSWAGVCGGTDAAGNYQTDALPAGTDYVAYVVAEEVGYKRQMWDHVPCPGNSCDFSTGTAITLGPDDAVNVNFDLEIDTSISGTISSAETGEVLANRTGRAKLYDLSGLLVGFARTNSEGVYRLVDITPGTYYVLMESFNDSHIDELYNSTDNIYCPRLSCDTNSGTQITIALGQQIPGIDAILDKGSLITGTVTQDGNPLGGIFINIYAANGHEAGFGITDGNGYYQSRSGFPAGDYKAANRWIVNGSESGNEAYQPLVYNSIDCGVPCNLGSGNLILVTGVNGNDANNIDFSFVEWPPGTISGSILDGNGQPTPGGAVRIFDANGNHVDDWWVNESGNFQTYDLPVGTYYALTQYTWGVIDERWDNDPCPNQLCDVTQGTPIIISSNNDTPVNFILDPIGVNGGRISGHLEDSAGVDLVNVQVIFYNINGDYLGEVRTDQYGNYQSSPFTNDFYYVRSHNAPGGLQNELYNDLPCTLGCDDQAFVTSGNAVEINDGDAGNIDFVLDVPLGNIISGMVTDAALGTPMPNINIVLFDEFGNWLGAETTTAADGSYVFTGLPDGAYKLYIPWVPEGYLGLLYNGVDCPGWNCNFETEGTAVPVSGNSEAGNIDFAFSHDGSTRIFGTVTRSDGAAVSSHFGYMGVQLYNSAGDWIDERGTNDAGQYQFNVDPDTTYYVVTSHDVQFHGLINEGWDNVQCFDDCNPLTIGATAIAVSAGVTAVRDFALDPSPSISGTVTAETGGALLANIEVCVTRRDGYWQGCTLTDVNGDYSVLGLPAETDLIPFINGSNGQPYLLETYIDQGQYDWANGTGLDISNVNATGIDFALAGGTIISGTLLSELDGPVTEGGAGFFNTDGTFIAFDQTDENGFWAIALADGDYFLYLEGWNSFGQYVDVFSNGTTEILCPEKNCDWRNNAPVITVAGSTLTINTTLQIGYQITGTVRDENGSPIDEGYVNIWDSSGNFVSGTNHAGNGDYFSNPLPNGTYFATIKGENYGRVSELYSGISCPQEYCDVTTGTEIVISGADEPGIDFTLIPQNAIGTIFGSILDSAGQPGPGGIVRMYDPSGNHVDDFGVDGNGNFETQPLPDGTYFAFTKFTYGVIDDRWDGIDGSPCLNQLCDVLAGTPIVISGGLNVTDIDFILDPITSGGRISGHAQDDGGNPLENLTIAFFNSNGEYVGEVRTDPAGNYQSMPFADETYYARTHNNEPLGLGRQMYDGFNCLPATTCDDPAFIAATGSPIDILGADFSAVDFVLSMPLGNIISGKISDDFTLAAMPDVYMVLLDESGNGIADTQTDQFGDYYFSGLPTGNYKVYALGVPEGYAGELYDDVSCPDWNCDFGAEGTSIAIPGVDPDGDSGGHDIELTFSGRRIFGTVTRSDTTEPVSSNYRWMGVEIFDSSGGHITTVGTNSAGQYQVTGMELAPGDYLVKTTHDTNFHGLINEAWDNYPCVGECDPLSGDTVTLVDNQTTIANFILDPAPSIRGTVIADNGGASLANIEVCVTRRDGYWQGCALTDVNGNYTVQGLPPEADLIPFVNDTNGQPYLLETYIDQPQYDWGNGTGVDISSASATLIDFSLADGTLMSGTLLSEFDGPVTNGGATFFRTDGSWVGFDHVNENGQWVIALPDGDYFLFLEGWDAFNSYVDIFTDGITELSCMNQSCDWVNQAPAFTIASSPRTFDATLALGNLVNGTLRVDDGVDITPVINEGSVAVYDANGNWVNGTGVDENGNWALHLGDGDYFFYFETWGTYEFFVSELHDGVDGVPCAWQQCFAGDWVNQGPKLTVDGSWTNPLNAELEMGIIFSGTLTDEITGDPIDRLRLYFYDEDIFATGTLTEAFRLIVRADSNGNYRTPAMQIINYLPFSTGYDLGYGREFYDNQKCDPVDCDDAYANRKALIAGVDFVAGDEVSVSFNLIRRVTFSGMVTDGVNPLADIAVDVWDTKGNLLETIWTDAGGSYFANFGGPNHAAAKYYITANGENNGFIGQVYGDPANGESNADCQQLYCVQGGTPGVTPISTLDGQDRIDINFSLVAQIPATISGSILDINGQPYPGGTARFYFATGEPATDAWVDSEGNFETGLLPDGTYFVVTKYTYDVIDDRWDGVNGSQCLNELCDVLAGTPILIAGGQNVTGIDFILDPINSGGRISGHAEDNLGIAIENMAIAIFNSNGDYLGETRTDSNGNYQTMPFADDTYFARTHNNEPGGLGRQLYNGFDCLPASDCNDSAYIAANGTAIQIAGSNYGGVDFVLSIPAGNVIFGKVTDDVIFAPLPDVYIVLFDESGGWIAEVVTDKFGDYYFSGLDDGDYKVYASGVPEGYSGELYNDIFCPDWSCDFGSEGDLVNVSGGDTGNINIALNYSTGTGSRIFGTVTRSDTLAPVSSQNVHFEILAFDSAGDFVGSSGINSAGQYQLHFPAGGDYYLVTQHDVGFHGLINEGWDNVQCYDNCNPIDIGATLIHVNDSETVVADFILDPAVRISGTVTDEVDGAALEGVTICWTSKANENPWKGCTQTDNNGDYQIAGLEPLADYVVWTWELGGLAYYRETYDDLPCCDGPWISGGTSIDVMSADQVADFALARSSTISGNVTDSATGLPIQNLRMQVWTPQCERISETYSDADGNYTLSGFDAGSYHVNAWGTELGYIQELYPDFKRWHPCRPDIQDGLPTALGDNDHASGIDFALDFGGSIRGIISDNVGTILPYNFGQARLHDLDGNQLMVIRNREDDSSYFLGGLQPGTYHVILSSRTLGLVDERFDDVTCPRNSCDSNLGVPIIVGPAEQIIGIDASLSLGATISGNLTDADSGAPIETCVAFYTTTGKYAGFACSDEYGDYTSSSGFPVGEYLVSNQFKIGDYEPVPLGYLPQVWKSDGSFGACGEPCDFLLGDTVTVSNTSPIIEIDLAMEFGSTIEGTVTTDPDATPLAGIQLQMLNALDASIIRTLFTDESGNYSFTGVGSGDYRLRTSNGIGYEDLLYDDLGDVSCNPFCDPLSGGVISAGSNTTDTINFDLQPTPAISGNVTDNTGAIATGTKVEAYDSLGTEIASATTDVAGNYTITNLWAGTFYVRTANIVGFVDVLYDGEACGASCDPLSGTGIVLAASGTQSGIDLQMIDSVNINGTVTDGTDAISGVTIELYLDTGAFVSSTTTDGSGAYRLGGLTAGNYHLVSRNSFGFVDEGAGGGVCQSTCAPTSTAIVTVADVPVTRDMDLSLGGEISGKVESDGTNLPSVTVAAFNDAGVQISSTVTDSGGNYLIRGLVGGNVYLRTSNAGSHRNQRYDGLLCDAFCDVLAGLPIPVALGETVPSINFNLESGFAISGTVMDSLSAGIGFVLVEAFDATGLPSGSAFSISSGAFAIDGLVAGDYRLRTTNSAGFVDVVLGGDDCTPEPCVVSSGTATNITDSDITGVNITLADGSPISGVATDTDGNPLPTGSALLYSTTGQTLKSAAINSGLFNFTGIADGAYYMLIKNDLGLVDQLYSGFDCPNGSCDVTAGTEIVIGAQPTSQMLYSTQSSGGDAGFKTQAIHTGSNHLQVALDNGTTITGSMRTESDIAVQLTGVYILDADGNVTAETMTDGLGNFETEAGLPDGTWYAATQHAGVEGVGNGLINEVYQNIVCTGDCEVDSQTATPLFKLNGVYRTVDFVLGTGGEISGMVSAQSDATPIAQAVVDLYDAVGNPVAQVTTDGQGLYTFTGLVSGEYRLLATPQVGAYAPVLFDGIDCSNGCVVTDGSPVVLSPSISSATEINFVLPSTVSDKNTDIDPTAQIGVGVDISQGSTVGAYAVIGAGTIVNRNVSIAERCKIGERVLIEQGVEIGAYCEIGDDSLIGRNAKIGEHVHIGSNTIIGKDNEIHSSVSIGSNVELGPGVKVMSGSCIPDDYGKIKKKSTITGNLCIP